MRNNADSARALKRKHRLRREKTIDRKPMLIAMLLCGLCLIAGLRVTSAAQAGCSMIYQDSAWAVSLCPTDPNVTDTMMVLLNGAEQPQPATHLEIAHATDDSTSWPTVAVMYASGFVRLKQNADPLPPLPFGSSFVLGPAYWSDAETYHHNPQLTRLALDTARLPAGPLQLQAQGANNDYAVSYELTLSPPSDEQIRLHVTQRYTATTNVTIDPIRHAEAQGFKLVQISSMFINEGDPCDGGYSDCHDSNAARFIGSDLARHQSTYTELAPSTFIFSPTLPLGSTWFDALHTDDTSWQGNTPNVRIVLDVLPDDRSLTPQGWINATTDPNDDNLALWLHDDGPASQAWSVGHSEQISYWLVAQDNPPAPWADQGLRNGLTFLNFEGDHNCTFVHDPSQIVSGSVQSLPAYTDTGLQLTYDLGSADYNWVQMRCDFDPPLDISSYDHLRFDWRGEANAGNSIEVGLIDQVGETQRIFARGYHHVTHRDAWGQLVIPFSFLNPWHGGELDPTHIVAFFVSVVKDPVADVGGVGHLAIDNLNAYNVQSRNVPADVTHPMTHTLAATRAAYWLSSQQRPTGLLPSWEEEAGCTAHIYDQALALIIFSHAGLWHEADAIVEGLLQTQNPDGSWYKSYDCSAGDLLCTSYDKWEGDIAWAIYALARYSALGGTHPQATTLRANSAAWLAARLGSDGCLEIDHTEGTIDAWWALQAAGSGFRGEADLLKECLLTHYWDDTMGRFKGGRNWQQPYLDNQTWGGAFLRAIGREADARRALSYADAVLCLPSQGGQLLGFDGQGGPWSVWNEGTGQYVAVSGARSAVYVPELLAQQRNDGAMPGSPDAFAGGGVWTTRWHGVAPTAWLYFALNPGEPFHATAWVYLPLIIRGQR